MAIGMLVYEHNSEVYTRKETKNITSMSEEMAYDSFYRLTKSKDILVLLDL